MISTGKKRSSSSAEHVPNDPRYTNGNLVQRVTTQLRVLCDVSNDFVGAAVLTVDGFIVSSLLPPSVDEELMSGLSSDVLTASQNLATTLMQADMGQVFVKTERGYVIIHTVDVHTVLVVLVTDRARLGHVFWEVDRTASVLTSILS